MREMVREKLRAVRGEISGAGTPGGPDALTIREAAELWLSEKKGKVADTTYDLYRAALERSIYPEYADTRVRDITDAEVKGLPGMLTMKAEREGKTATPSGLLQAQSVLIYVLDFAKGDRRNEGRLSQGAKIPFTPLGEEELDKILFCAKHNVSPDMLAVLLCIYCGLRIGEVCALEWSDVSMERMEIFVHQSAHRIHVDARGEGEPGNKTRLVVQEIPTKKQIRVVPVPEELSGYISGQYAAGRSVLSGLPDTPTDIRTLEHRIQRLFEQYRIENANFQRFHKTYAEGRADRDMLRRVFTGDGPIPSCKSAPNREWLLKEMAADLKSLRLLIGYTAEDMGEILGVSASTYLSWEKGKRTLEWRHYLSLLFLFRYNQRTAKVVECLGLSTAPHMDGKGL